MYGTVFGLHAAEADRAREDRVPEARRGSARPAPRSARSLKGREPLDATVRPPGARAVRRAALDRSGSAGRRRTATSRRPPGSRPCPDVDGARPAPSACQGIVTDARAVAGTSRRRLLHTRRGSRSPRAPWGSCRRGWPWARSASDATGWSVTDTPRRATGAPRARVSPDVSFRREPSASVGVRRDREDQPLNRRGERPVQPQHRVGADALLGRRPGLLALEPAAGEPDGRAQRRKPKGPRLCGPGRSGRGRNPRRRRRRDQRAHEPAISARSSRSATERSSSTRSSGVGQRCRWVDQLEPRSSRPRRTAMPSTSPGRPNRRRGRTRGASAPRSASPPTVSCAS